MPTRRFGLNVQHRREEGILTIEYWKYEYLNCYGGYGNEAFHLIRSDVLVCYYYNRDQTYSAKTESHNFLALGNILSMYRLMTTKGIHMKIAD